MTWTHTLLPLPQPVAEDRPVVLEATDLAVQFPDGTVALNRIHLQVRAGEHVGVVGPNGAGKSTLLLALAGLLPRATGTVEMEGVPLKPVQRRGRLGILFQRPDDQLFCTSVADDIAFGPRNQGLAEDEVAKRVEQAFAAVGLHDRRLLHRPAMHLSVGQKQAVALAAVLAMQPPILAFDEPTSALDPHGRTHLLETIQGLERAVILVTQDLYVAAQLCSRLVVLDGGEIVAEGPAPLILMDRELLSHHRLEFGSHRELVERVEQAARQLQAP